MRSDGFYIETIHGDYVGYDDPTFFDTEHFPWVTQLEHDFYKIIDELSPLLIDSVAMQNSPESAIQFPKKGWKVLPLYFNGIKVRRNLKRFPFLTAALKDIPHLITAAISVLEPGAKLLPHNGSTNAIMRVHFPLKVPGAYPECGMVIDGKSLSWEEGKVFMFCDMKVHHVQNMTDKRRYILLMDVMRPEFVHLKKKVCIHIIARTLVNMLIYQVRSILR